MISSIISRLVILLFGTLYPAYASHKAMKTKNVKEYVKWMMYWVVFAFFTCAETFTDVFFGWLPFYYEIKIMLVIWLLSPVTKGSSFLYRKFVHPVLSSKEQEIDECISRVKKQGYRQFLNLGSKSVMALMQTAIRNINPMFTNSDPAKEQKDHRDIVKARPPQDLNEFYTDDDDNDVEMEVPPKLPTQPKASTCKEKSTKKSRKNKNNEETDNNSSDFSLSFLYY